MLCSGTYACVFVYVFFRLFLKHSFLFFRSRFCFGFAFVWVSYIWRAELIHVYDVRVYRSSCWYSTIHSFGFVSNVLNRYFLVDESINIAVYTFYPMLVLSLCTEAHIYMYIYNTHTPVDIHNIKYAQMDRHIYNTQLYNIEQQQSKLEAHGRIYKHSYIHTKQWRQRRRRQQNSVANRTQPNR